MQGIEDRLRVAFARRRSLWYFLGLAAVLAALYWPAASLRGIFYVGDILRLNYPARATYAQALREGRVLWWTTGALGGYPILAEGQTGAYYPPNLLLYRWLPVGAALNYSLLLSFWIAGAGLFMYARALGLRRGPAFLGACTFMLGGFFAAHLTHVNMVAAAAWLPWLLWAVERGTQGRGWRAWAMAAAFFGLMGLAGHPQILLLSALPAAAQAALGPLADGYGRWSARRQLTQLGFCGGALLAGGALAVAQFLPSYQLMALSRRGQPLTYEFFTSFSLPPSGLARMVWPYSGNPYPAVSEETVGYVGILPLVLAALAPTLRRGRAAAFWLATAVLGLALAVGRSNPAYRLLWHVPVLNRFRVPARYLLWVDLAITLLAAMGADALLARTRAQRARGAQGARRAWDARGRMLAPGAALSLATLGALWSTWAPLEGLLAQWRWLPAVWLGATAALLALLIWRPPRQLWLALAVGLLLADLGAFLGVHNRTYNATITPAELEQAPESAAFLQADAGTDLYRVYTPDEAVPDMSLWRESLFPNTQLLYGVDAAGGYYPLVPDPQEWLRSSLTARLLDLLNVRYVLVPQQAPQEGRQDFFVAEDPFAPSLAGSTMAVQATGVSTIEAEGCLLDDQGLAAGTPVAEVVVRGAGDEVTWTLRAGAELAGWGDAGSGLPVARTWPARFPAAPADGLGRTYLARHELSVPLEVSEVEVRALIPAGRLRVERLRLVGAEGHTWLLPAAAGGGDHVLAYCSPGVAIYRNEGAGPRATLIHRTQVVANDQAAFEPLTAHTFAPQEEAIMVQGAPLSGEAAPGESVTVEAYEPEYVRLRAVVASGPAYLVLADSYYPGWQARVDGQPAAIERADLALRAVRLGPGEHVVEFSFAPQRWHAAALASVAGWGALAALALWRR